MLRREHIIAQRRAMFSLFTLMIEMSRALYADMYARRAIYDGVALMRAATLGAAAQRYAHERKAAEFMPECFILRRRGTRTAHRTPRCATRCHVIY